MYAAICQLPNRVYKVRIEKMTLYGIPVFINYLTLFTSKKSHFSQFVYYYSLNVIHVIQKNCRDRNYQYIRDIVYHLVIKLNLVKV